MTARDWSVIREKIELLKGVNSAVAVVVVSL
jgi:hypothetical protein